MYIVKKMINKQDIRGIYHFTAQECMTKYQMCGKKKKSQCKEKKEILTITFDQRSLLSC